MKNFLIFILSIFFISGCATTASLDRTRINAPERLKGDVLNYSFDEVYKASKMAILNLGLALDSEGKKDKVTVLYAKSTADLMKVLAFGDAHGEMMGIYITPISEKQTKVDVAIQKQYLLDLGYKDYRGLVINQIKTILDLQNKK